jgi:hypothetical protein
LNFKPWCKANVLADGASIKGYLGEVINEFKLKEKIVSNPSLLFFIAIFDYNLPFF